MSKERIVARQLRLAVIQNIYNQGLITEKDAKELLSGELSPGNDATIVDDSNLLDMGEKALELITESECDKVYRVPKDTHIWQVAKLREWKPTDSSRLPDIEYEEVKLIPDENGIRKGYSKTLDAWIIANE